MNSVENILGGCDFRCNDCFHLFNELMGNRGKNVQIKLSDSELSRIVTGKLAVDKEHFSVGGEAVMFEAIRWVRLTS